MKYLRLFIVTLFIFSTTLPSLILPQKIFAQEKEATRESAEIASSLIFNKANSGASSGANISTSKADTDAFKALIDLLNKSQLSYRDTFNDTLSKGSSVLQAYTLGMKNASISAQNDSTNINIIKKNTNASAILNTYITSVSNQASNPDIAGSFINETPLSDNAKQDLKAQSDAAKNSTTIDPTPCSIFSSKGNLLTCADQLFTWFVKKVLLNVAGFLLWLTANMLDYSIQISILNFGNIASDSLYPIWLVVRQIVSLFIVFAGLWLGFMYIIDRGDKFTHYIPWVILFALFVNFSYPISRTLIDISNVISVNIYQSTFGNVSTDPSLAANVYDKNSPGALIMTKLGLQSLAASASDIPTQTDLISSIKTTPGSLIAVAFVLYAAWVFFIATTIIVIRAAVLIMMIIASPILFVDSVIPKLGDAAQKMRKIYLEQLIVAPVFMIMLALTLKFLTVFSGNNMGSGDTIKTFFNILMMIVMLHIMLKVVKSISGESGRVGSEWLGKVGGFGLGVATGGTGMLARGTVGRAAARLRDSKTLDSWQGSRTGRGLKSISNSLANSTYDVRNVTPINKSLTRMGMGGGLIGVGMGQGSNSTYEKNFKIKKDNFQRKYEDITSDEARTAYYNQTKNSVTSRAQRMVLGKSDSDLITKVADKKERDIQDKKKDILLEYEKADQETKSRIYSDNDIDPSLQKRLGAVKDYLDQKYDESSPDSYDKFIENKAKQLFKIGDINTSKKIIENDPFKDLEKGFEKEIEDKEKILGELKGDKEKYDAQRREIETAKQAHASLIKGIKEDILKSLEEMGGVEKPTTNINQNTNKDVKVESSNQLNKDISGENSDWKMTLGNIGNEKLAETPAFLRKETSGEGTSVSLDELATQNNSGVTKTGQPASNMPLNLSSYTVDSAVRERLIKKQREAVISGSAISKINNPNLNQGPDRNIPSNLQNSPNGVNISNNSRPASNEAVPIAA